MSRTFALFAVFALSISKLPAATLLEIDFTGAANSNADGAVSSADGQFTIVDSGITFNSPGSALTVIGNPDWVYDGTSAAVVNTDVFNGASANFGSTSRFDLDFGLATAGHEYAISGLELVIRANNDADILFSAGYRDLSNTIHIVGAETIATQSGADPRATYSIDLSGENLMATDSTSTFSRAGNGKIRFLFRDPAGGTANDNFQVDAIRVLGTVTAVPEPSSIAFLGVLAAGGLVRRRSACNRKNKEAI